VKIKVRKGQSFRSKLFALGACDDADDWVGNKSLRCAWRTCSRGDWMIWLAAKAGVDRKALALVACGCARLSLVHVPSGEDRPRIAI
jgi:hypothetical protein